MKTIWIIDHYSSEPQYSGISRQFDFAIELGKRGYNVVVLASSFSHFTHRYISKEKITYSDVSENVHYVYIRTTEYSANDGFKRAQSMISFLNGVVKYQSNIARAYGIPDVIEGCSVHPLTWIAARIVSKKYGARFCAEVRDFWPQFWIDSGIKSKYHPMCMIFALIENLTFKYADKIIYSMSRGEKYICCKKKIPEEKVTWIGQPMDCARFDQNAKKYELLPEDIRKFMDNSFVCTFAGYYMAYEGVFVMLEAAKILLKKGLPIKMIFVGSGEAEEQMRNYKKQNNLDNVLIGHRVEKNVVPALLSRSNVCMAHLEIKDHREAFQYGTSKNKLNDYLYSGSCTLYGFMDKDDFVEKCGGGLIFEPYNADDLAKHIEYVYNMPREEQKRMGERGRDYIRKNHAVPALTDKLEQVFWGK